jgi:hypothetical protein
MEFNNDLQCMWLKTCRFMNPEMQWVLSISLQRCQCDAPSTGRTVIWVSVHPRNDIWVWRNTVEWYWQGKPNILETTCFRLTLVTTNPTWTAWSRTRASAVRGQRLTALSYGTVAIPTLSYSSFTVVKWIIQVFMIFVFPAKWSQSRVVLALRTVVSWVSIPLEKWMIVRAFLCCAVLFQPCDGRPHRQRSPSKLEVDSKTRQKYEYSPGRPRLRVSYSAYT